MCHSRATMPMKRNNYPEGMTSNDLPNVNPWTLVGRIAVDLPRHKFTQVI